MADPSPPPTGNFQSLAEEDPEFEARLRTWSLTRSVVLSSLAVFFLLSPGNFMMFDATFADADAFVRTHMSMAAVSFAVLCLSWAAAISASAAVNTGRRPAPGELFSKVRRLWREPSMARLYSTVLLLGYALHLILVLAVVLLTSGGRLGWRVLLPLVCLLSLLLRSYVGAVWSVATGAFLLEEGKDGAAPALWGAVEIMDEKLLGFLAYFLLHAFIYVLLSCVGLWNPGPVTMDAVWMLGVGGLLGYVGVLLQI